MLRRVILLLGLLVAAQPAAAQLAWRMATEYPATAIPGQGVSTFARLVEAGTGGRIVIGPSFDAAAGFKSAEMLDAVASGRLDLGDAFAGALGAADPVFAISTLPFVVGSIDDAKQLADLVRPSYAAAVATRGQRLLYLTPWPASGIWSKRPLGSGDDLKALAIRTYDAMSSRVLAGAGATATNISFADTMPKLRDGTVNAVLSSGDGGAGRRLWESLPSFTEINYAFPVSIATIAAGLYDALPADLRRAVDEAAAETERLQWVAVRTRLDENYARMRANGVAIDTTPPDAVMAELRRAAGPAIVEWARTAGPDAASILDRFRAGAR